MLISHIIVQCSHEFLKEKMQRPSGSENEITV